MKKINTNSRYSYTTLFDSMTDTQKLICETVGKDEYGNYILHISSTYNIGNAYSTSDEYYILTVKEYKDRLEQARKNRLISWLKYRRLLKEIHEPIVSSEKITSFERITLHISGMRFRSEYEILMKGTQAEITQYSIRCSKDGDEKVPEKSALCSKYEMLDLLNKCSLLSWDGFHGKHPKGVKDGIMFSLQAVLNGGKTIKAEGSENFPRHYRDFTDGLYSLLNDNRQ